MSSSWLCLALSVGQAVAQASTCAAGANKCHGAAKTDTVGDASGPASAELLQRMRGFFGEPRAREDSWLRSASAALGSRDLLPAAAAGPIGDAVELMREPLVPQTVSGGWEAISEAAHAAPGSEAVAELRARFAWRYQHQLSAVLGTQVQAETAAAAEAVSHIPGAGEVAAGLMLARDGSSLPKAIRALNAARKARPQDSGLRLRLGIALAGTGRKRDAVAVLRPRALKIMGGDAVGDDSRLLAAFAFLAATGEDQSRDTQKDVMAALSFAARDAETRGGALAAVYKASLAGSVPFEKCDAAYQLERDLIFSPGNCLKLLEFGTLLRSIEQVPEAIAEGSRTLSGLAFECPKLAEELSGMSQKWLEKADAKRGTVGLGSDLHAVADIRGGIKEASYASWSSRARRGEAVEERQFHVEVLRAAEILSELPGQSGGAAAKGRCQQHPARAELRRPQHEDKLGCPSVRPEEFAQRCLRRHRPCVLRGEAANFLRQGGRADQEAERWVEIAGNASVKVSFPFAQTASKSMPTLNDIQRTSDFFRREDVRASLAAQGAAAPDGSEAPWTLVRPGSWSMRLRDAVAWARALPQDIYMNQAMLADLGSAALAELRTPSWVADAGLRLLSPSLWLASGAVATGYHRDGPENLLAQLEGAKEVILLRPSEVENLYYDSAPDVEPDVQLQPDGSARVAGLRTANRSSDGHSMVEIASTEAQAAASDFPRYARAAGLSCSLSAGDVLYIPSFWHHAVATFPSSACIGLSLNLWYFYADSPSWDKAVAHWKAAKQ